MAIKEWHQLVRDRGLRSRESFTVEALTEATERRKWQFSGLPQVSLPCMWGCMRKQCSRLHASTHSGSAEKEGVHGWQ